MITIALNTEFILASEAGGEAIRTIDVCTKGYPRLELRA